MLAAWHLLAPNHTSAVVEDEHITYAAVQTKEVSRRAHIELKGGAGCIATEDMKESVGNYTESFNELGAGGASAEGDGTVKTNIAPKAWLLFDHEEGEEGLESDKSMQTFNSPLIEPKNWGHELPAVQRSSILSLPRVLIVFRLCA